MKVQSVVATGRCGTESPWPWDARLGGPNPERHLRRLHRLVEHAQQLGRERVEVNLVAEPEAEGLDGSGCVIASPVEAPVDPALDTTPYRLEQRGH
jgi:hypothetical protein